MKQLKLYMMLLAAALMIGSCGGDDDESGSTSGGNGSSVNANANATDKSQYATRLEVPRLHKGNNYLLLVRTDPQIGVNYMVEWDCLRKAQRWVCWHWTNSNSGKGWDRKNWENGATFNGYGGSGDPFQPDPDIPREYRSELSDYSGSGYARGHMCASEDRISSQNVNGQTFYLSNMHPQIHGHNGGVWQKLEGKVRDWRDAALRNGGEMYICKGGTIYESGSAAAENGTLQGIIGTVGSNKIPVPKYFFMAILKKTAAGTYQGLALWSEHKADSSTDPTPYMITIDELEKRTGYDFFCNLPDVIENTVEKTLVTSEWK